MVRLVIAHRSALVRDVLRMLGSGRDILVVGEAQDADELVELCRRELPDVVLAEGDYDEGGIESALPMVVATGAGVAVICDDPSPERLTRVLASGALGWLGHDVGPMELLDVITAVANGAAVLDPSATRTILDQWRRLRVSCLPAVPAGSGAA